MVDWSLADRIAGFLISDGDQGAPRPGLQAMVDDSAERVVAYAKLEPLTALPAPELVDRRTWARANLVSMRPLLDPIGAQLGDGLGPLAGAARAGAGTLLGAQAGALLGLASKRVLGQYDTALVGEERPPRLLLVGPNLDEAARLLDAAPDEFDRWVALHEVTHAVQFAAVPWLRGHLGAMVGELTRTLEVKPSSTTFKLPSLGDVRGWASAVSRGEILELVTSPEQRALVDRMQATMALVEGHAEHVMDEAGVEVLPSLAKLRAAMGQRRREASLPARLLAKLLGLDLKLRQYEQGKAFCDGVVAEAGIDVLNRAWSDPALLPTLAELDDPQGWVDRTAAPAAA
jgi:coenzyme F420 biosynthesis associated uncharacterized protein